MLLDRTKQICDYDYNKMLEDFRVETRQNNINDQKKKFWKDYSNNYERKIEEMKERNKIKFRERRLALQKRLKEKEKSIILAQNEILKSKQLEKQKIIGNLAQKELSAKKQVDEYQRELEMRRLQVERETEKKSKFII